MPTAIDFEKAHFGSFIKLPPFTTDKKNVFC